MSSSDEEAPDGTADGRQPTVDGGQGAADGSKTQTAGGWQQQAADGWQNQLNALGGFIRVQRRLADMSLREMAALTSVSNAYLSQIERGLHQPSLRVLRSIAQALGIAPEDLLRRANILSPDGETTGGSHDGAAGSGTAGSGTAGSGTGGSGATGAGPGGGRSSDPDTEAAIATDPRLSPSQREALLNVYRSFRDST
jgi:DNA-binding XRE family transcriptional regulator